MIGALWTGISGLRASQTALDNESNNVANVNTIGYKASRVSFADMMYQDSIGKGAKVTSAEKQYTQGSLNSTGSDYDVALYGDGFFVVSKENSNGTSETFYTRAGNLRMGENGNLQDANDYEVQGWAMNTIDPTSDVTSTNSNWTYFNDNFTQIAGNQIVQYSTKVETYAAKITDYEASAKSDSDELTGSSLNKNASDKISDIEQLISKYQKALTEYAKDPDAISTSAIAQVSQIDFPDGALSSLDSTGNTITVYINGSAVSVQYQSVSASAEFKQEVVDAINAVPSLYTYADYDGDSIGSGTSVATLDQEDMDILASRVATYKALADKISEITGLSAYTVNSGGNESTAFYDVIEGVIQIESIDPGEDFVIGDVTETSNNSVTTDGTSTTLTESVEGTGSGAVESAMTALKNAVSGKQYDTYLESEVLTDDNDVAHTWEQNDALTYEITIDGTTYTLSSSNDATGTPLGTLPATYDAAVAQLIENINQSGANADITAKNINGYLVIESDKYGEEFTGQLSFVDDDNSVANDNSGTTETYDKEKSTTLSGNSGANGEFMQIIATVDQEASKTALQLELDTLGLTDTPAADFSVDESGLITMTQDGVDYVVGQIAIAQFSNNIELESVGDNLLAETVKSGRPTYTINNDNGTTIEGKTLELSTADLSESLVNLMVYQRAFEANSKSITTADEILNTLIDLKR